MFEKSLRTLEFYKIIDMLYQEATGEKTKDLIKSLTPVSDFDEVNLALEETDNAVVAMLKYGAPPNAGVNSQEEYIKRAISGGVLSIKELLSISALMRVFKAFKNYFENTEDFPILEEYLSYIFDYPEIENKIENAILNEEELKDTASNELFSIRRSIKNLNEKIRSSLNSFITSEKYSKYLQEQIITTRNGRFVIPVKAEHKADIKGMVHDMSQSGATLFIEPQSVVEANNKLKELEIEEIKETEKILRELSSDVLNIGESLLVNISYLTKLDFAFSKAKLALKMEAVKPKLNKEKRIVLKKARHPLIDAKKVVPISVTLGEDFNALIITGPNTGGKTVSIKTVGLLTLMAQAGLHIPASSGSEIFVFDDVFADIGDEQSIEQSLSTFSSHMTTIVSILKNFNSDSLVLFDELGAGTDPVEGAALAMAIIEEIKKCGVLLMATTHYSELKTYAMTTPGVSNASLEFDIKTLKPTYKLLIGMPGKSNAFAISEKLGMQKYLIDRATAFISSENIKFEDVLKELEQNKKALQKERDKAQKYLKE